MIPGERLPGDADLGEQHDVSRSTVREAVRLLEAQRLVVTVRGATGGTFVAEPAPSHIAEGLETSLDLLVAHDGISVEELLEARRLFEVPAAALAAKRRTADQLLELRRCIDGGRACNEEFHTVLLAAAGNPLVEVMCQPMFEVLRTRLDRERASAEFFAEIDEDHRRLLLLIEAGDGEGTAAEMARHLDHLADAYRGLGV